MWDVGASQVDVEDADGVPSEGEGEGELSSDGRLANPAFAREDLVKNNLLAGDRPWSGCDRDAGTQKQQTYKDDVLDLGQRHFVVTYVAAAERAEERVVVVLTLAKACHGGMCCVFCAVTIFALRGPSRYFVIDQETRSRIGS